MSWSKCQTSKKDFPLPLRTKLLHTFQNGDLAVGIHWKFMYIMNQWLRFWVYTNLEISAHVWEQGAAHSDARGNICCYDRNLKDHRVGGRLEMWWSTKRNSVADKINKLNMYVLTQIVLKTHCKLRVVEYNTI